MEARGLSLDGPYGGHGYQLFASGKDGINPANISDWGGAFVLAGFPLALSLFVQACSIALPFPD